MKAMSPTVQFWIFLVAFLVLGYAALRAGIGRTKTDFVALGLAIALVVVVWNTGAVAY